MAEIVDFVADTLFFAWLLHDGDGVAGVPKFVGPKMTWQQGEHHLSFGLGRVSIDGVDKIYSVFWSEGLEFHDAKFFAVERSDWATLGFVHGSHSCDKYSDFGSSIKPMKVQGMPYAFLCDNQDGVVCKLWAAPQPQKTGLQHEFESHAFLGSILHIH
jgi:hypothetical protein